MAKMAAFISHFSTLMAPKALSTYLHVLCGSCYTNSAANTQSHTDDAATGAISEFGVSLEATSTKTLKGLCELRLEDPLYLLSHEWSQLHWQNIHVSCGHKLGARHLEIIWSSVSYLKVSQRKSLNSILFMRCVWNSNTSFPSWEETKKDPRILI